jgi:uracil phosphoribosyltransferase
MITHDLSLKNSVLNTFTSELRDKIIQKDSMRFRRNVERIGEILGYEMSKNLNYQVNEIITPLGIKEVNLPSDDLVICSILRAGIPLHRGLLNYFDKAENAFISAYRRVKENDEFDIVVDYFASPSLENKTLFLVDPMLATGQSLVKVYQSLLSHGRPSKLHIISVIASIPGIDYLNRFFDDSIDFWVASIDPDLNSKSYIVPGLGDAGDLAFGSKI